MDPKKASLKKQMQSITETQQQVARPLTPPYDADLEFVAQCRDLGITPAKLRLDAIDFRKLGRSETGARRATWLKAASKYKKAAQFMERSFQ